MGNADGLELIQIGKLKLTSITVKLWITSLNSHVAPQEHHHKMLNRKRSRSSAAFFGK